MNANPFQEMGRGAVPVPLTILLYDQLIQTWPARGKPSAAAALSSAQEIGHAVAIVGYLQAALGQKDAGKINGSLRRFYVMLREKPMEAQVRSFAANPE
jgi:flagellin-specific chaperone FliS